MNNTPDSFIFTCVVVRLFGWLQVELLVQKRAFQVNVALKKLTLSPQELAMAILNADTNVLTSEVWESKV